jgi:hypothetical protein
MSDPLSSSYSSVETFPISINIKWLRDTVGGYFSQQWHKGNDSYKRFRRSKDEKDRVSAEFMRHALFCSIAYAGYTQYIKLNEFKRSKTKLSLEEVYEIAVRFKLQLEKLKAVSLLNSDELALFQKKGKEGGEDKQKKEFLKDVQPGEELNMLAHFFTNLTYSQLYQSQDKTIFSKEENMVMDKFRSFLFEEALNKEGVNPNYDYGVSRYLDKLNPEFEEWFQAVKEQFQHRVEALAAEIDDASSMIEEMNIRFEINALKERNEDLSEYGEEVKEFTDCIKEKKAILAEAEKKLENFSEALKNPYLLYTPLEEAPEPFNQKNLYTSLEEAPKTFNQLIQPVEEALLVMRRMTEKLTDISNAIMEKLEPTQEGLAHINAAQGLSYDVTEKVLISDLNQEEYAPSIAETHSPIGQHEECNKYNQQEAKSVDYQSSDEDQNAFQDPLDWLEAMIEVNREARKKAEANQLNFKDNKVTNQQLAEMARRGREKQQLFAEESVSLEDVDLNHGEASAGKAITDEQESTGDTIEQMENSEVAALSGEEEKEDSNLSHVTPSNLDNGGVTEEHCKQQNIGNSGIDRRKSLSLAEEMPPPYSSQSGSAPIEIEAGNGHQTNQDLDHSNQSNLGEKGHHRRRYKRSHHKSHSSPRSHVARSSKSQVPATDLFNRDEPKSLSLFARISQRWQKSLEAAKEDATETKAKRVHHRSHSDKENDPAFFFKNEITQSRQLNADDEPKRERGHNEVDQHKERGRSRRHRRKDRQALYHHEPAEFSLDNRYRSKSRATQESRLFLRKDMPRYYDERDDSENRVQPLR